MSNDPELILREKLYMQISNIIQDDRFCGVWAYRPQNKQRRYSATVIVDGKITETEMHDHWTAAVREAGELLEEENENV